MTLAYAQSANRFALQDLCTTLRSVWNARYPCTLLRGFQGQCKAGQLVIDAIFA